MQKFDIIKLMLFIVCFLICMLGFIFISIFAQNPKNHPLQKGCIVQYNALGQRITNHKDTYIVQDTVTYKNIPHNCTPCIPNLYIRLGEFTYVDSTFLIHKCKK